MLVAVVQFAPALGDVAANLRVITSAVAEAGVAGVDLVVAPEMSLTGWTLRDPAARARHARDVEEVALPELRQQAVSRGMAIVVGGPVRADAGTGRRDGRPFANAAIMLGPDGSRTEYHKIHLFGDERSWWAAGREAAVGQADGVRIGLTICYDAEFPEVPRMTRLPGADLLAVPTTNMTPYEHDQDVIFAARAIENECPVIVANRVGTENDWTYFGRSLVVDQRGRIVAQAGSGDELLLAEIQPTLPGDAALSYLSRRRPEVYGPLVAPISRSTTS
jgi:predicted amidohydrolase